MLHITPSERQALRLLAQDNPITEVAQALGVSASAVDSQLGVLFARMGVSCKAEAVESASRRGLLVLEHDTDARPETTEHLLSFYRCRAKASACGGAARLKPSRDASETS